ncbi:Hypothetical protein R9X50_00346100 [Acrodontium crateriforme]|uniref:Uncharacterized protein n=1 Tax=Acrodontium crateriforme TaxID=150365 RepID=A0AAQ3R9F3_9PEZI|nr:Hypothetical protein R9X50_00346100 [Acrodontium crateriforme]
MSSVRDHAPAGSILLVIHDFVARSGDELSLAKGDRIELIERDDEFGDGWFLGRHLANGGTGLFPEVYTTPAPKGTLNNAAANSRRASDGPHKPVQPMPNMSLSPQRHVSASAVPRPASSGNTQSTFAEPLRTSLPTQAAAARTQTLTTDSPVMNETLSVIDEHIIDMKTPRSSYANGGNKRDTIGSVYSSQPSLQRISYIPGTETDEDDNQLHTYEEVFSWSPEQVAEYLEDHGVEKMHCEVFQEQEISGEVLLAMDQSSLFIKEFELGPVGRRLKTWGKIKVLHEEVKQARSARPASPFPDSPDNARRTSLARNRSSTIGTMMPRALNASPSRQIAEGSAPISIMQPPQSTSMARPSTGVSPLQNMIAMPRPERSDHIFRPSAHNIRMSQSRRHSSIDSTNESANFRGGHKKQPSIDQQWQPGQSQIVPSGILNNKPPYGHSHTMSADSSMTTFANRSSVLVMEDSIDNDKGYFSSTEVEKQRRANKPKVLQKNPRGDSPSTHSRTSSFTRFSASSPAKPKRISSSGSQGPISPKSVVAPSTSIFGMWNNKLAGHNTNLRSATTPGLEKPMTPVHDSASPVVTKLDYNNNNTPSSPAAHKTSETSSVNIQAPSPSSGTFGFLGSKFRSAGLRTSSDAVTKDEKTAVAPTIPSSLKEDGLYMSRTGSTTPSTEAQSVDYQKSEEPSRTSAGSGSGMKLMPPSNSKRRGAKQSKKMTSAYTRGLEQKSPAEAMTTCDYSGWMKKKSGSLMTTWKPRLFILKGRRLSYYYKDDDTEEKGLIDISFHRVLPAHKEMLTGIHASVTRAGAGTQPTSPASMSTPTTAEQDLKSNPPIGEDDDTGLFIFKLVPPKAGLSKAVNFTKPTVHYFAVNSRQEGRLWMAALMKATIDRDEEGVVTTTYNQKTISLAKARARKERPPALREEGEIPEHHYTAPPNGTTAPPNAETETSSIQSHPGLGIGGVGLSPKSHDDNLPARSPHLTVSGAETFADDAASHDSRYTETTNGGTESHYDDDGSNLSLAEKEAVALNTA